MGWFGMDGYWDWITIYGIGINGCQRDVTLFWIRYMLNKDKGSPLCWLFLHFVLLVKCKYKRIAWDIVSFVRMSFYFASPRPLFSPPVTASIFCHAFSLGVCDYHIIGHGHDSCSGQG